MREVSQWFESFHNSPPIPVEGGHLISLRAPLAVLAMYASVQEWNPNDVVAIGQNGAVPDLAREDLEVHLIVVVSDHDMADVAGSIDKRVLDAHMLGDFDYANMIAGFNNGVRLVNFGEAFAANPFGELVTDMFFKMFFNHANQLKLSEDLSHVLLLIGRDGDRTLCAKIAGREDTYRMLPSPFASATESRHVVVGRNILLTAAFEGNTIYGIEADSLVDYLTDHESVLMWSAQRIGHSIEDFAVVDGTSDTVILTLADGEFRLAPMIVHFNRDNLALSPSVVEGISFKDFDKEIISPVVRVARSGRIVLADRRNTSAFLRFDHPSSFGSKFENMFKRTVSHQLSAQRSVIGI